MLTVRIGKQNVKVKGGVRVRLKGGLSLDETNLPEAKARLEIVARGKLTGNYDLKEKDGIYTLELEAIIDRGTVEIAPPDPSLFDDVEAATNPHIFMPSLDDLKVCALCGEDDGYSLHVDKETGEIGGGL